jgi:hypothetical protein
MGTHSGSENGRSAWVALCANPTRTDTDTDMDINTTDMKNSKQRIRKMLAYTLPV